MIARTRHLKLSAGALWRRQSNDIEVGEPQRRGAGSTPKNECRNSIQRSPHWSSHLLAPPRIRTYT